MEVKYIKQEISTEICEDGGATAMIVGNKVLPLGTAVEEAISGGYALGDKTLLTSEVMGVVRSMVDNCAKDGNARQIDGLFTVTPRYYGLINPEKGHNPAVNGVELKIRLLKELKVDTSKWTYTDVTPGKEPIKAQNVSTGAVTGVVALGEGNVIKVTGNGLENTTGVDWEVPDTLQSGTFAANKVTKSATVVTIADGLASLNLPANDGRKIVFTVRGAKNASKVSGTMKYTAPLRHISLNSMGATEGATSTAFQMKVVNPDGVRGYATGAGGTSIKADLAVGDAVFADSTLTLGEDGFFRGTAETASEAGMIATVTLHPDPAKTDFDQTDVTHSEEIAPA